MCNNKLNDNTFSPLTQQEMFMCEGGGPGAAIVFGIWGGAIGMLGAVCGGGDLWKGYVAGAITGAAIGLALPTI